MTRTMIPLRCAALMLCLLLLCPDAGAQRRKGTFRCPPPMRGERIRGAGGGPGSYFELGAGVTYPFRYTNSGGVSTGRSNGFYYTAQPLPYITYTAHLVYRDRLTLFVGGELTGSQQGLLFKYDAGGLSLRDAHYTTSIVVRFGAGAGFQLTPRLKAYGGPYIAYTSFHATTTTGRTEGSGTITSPVVNWSAADENSHLIPGLRAGVQYNITYRLMANAIFSADFGPSPATSGTATAGAAQFYGYSKPYLFYTGLTLGYKLFDREED